MIRILTGLIAIVLGTATATAETIETGGVARTFLTQFPDSKPAPLVIVLHGKIGRAHV